MLERQQLPSGSVTSPAGFQAAGVHCGIKQSAPDLMLLRTVRPAVAAAVFTRNKLKAAPVIVTRENLKSPATHAVVVNSGVANSCTGAAGLEDARRMAALAAAALDILPEQVLVGSTGLIGAPLPLDKIAVGVRAAAAALSDDGGHDAARAIMTTDTRAKCAACELPIDGRTATIGGIAKGAGMIAPNMATMLAYITTDAAIEKTCLQRLLRRAVDSSFNSITVDGDNSTNDMVVALANGAAGNEPLHDEHPQVNHFARALSDLCTFLAREIVRDGEGATTEIEVAIHGAATPDEAKQAARTVAESPLVKTAFFGGDPNWGRIAAAVGRAGVAVNPSALCISIGDVQVVTGGAPADFDHSDAEAAAAADFVPIAIDLGVGDASWTVWTCDFSYDYVRINAEYHT